MAMSGDTFGCHNWSEEYHWHLGGGGQGYCKCPAVNRVQAPHLAPVSGATVWATCRGPEWEGVDDQVGVLSPTTSIPVSYHSDRHVYSHVDFLWLNSWILTPVLTPAMGYHYQDMEQIYHPKHCGSTVPLKSNPSPTPILLQQEKLLPPTRALSSQDCLINEITGYMTFQDCFFHTVSAIQVCLYFSCISNPLLVTAE